MGIFENIFRRPRGNMAGAYFKMLNGYTPVFTTTAQSVYEMDLTRGAIDAFARHCGKLKPEMQGSARHDLLPALQWKPNRYMDTYKFLYRIATILMVQNTAFIVPIEDAFGRLIGYYPILPSRCEVIDVNGAAFLRYTFSNGQKAAIEFERVGIMTRHQYDNDLFGSSNAPMATTLELMRAQNEGIIQGIKNGAFIRFIARLTNVFKPSEIADERRRFTDENLSADNASGVLIFDQKYADVKPIESKPYIVNAPAMAQIKDNVYGYFGTNDAIMKNTWKEDDWNAFYEGMIEPFALQLSIVLTNMTFTPREIAFGNAIIFTANRLQYASNTTKLALTQLFDRGLMTRNQMNDVWNLPRVEGGDVYYIRKEYVEVDKLSETGEKTNDAPAADEKTNEEEKDNAGKDGSGISGNAATADGGGDTAKAD